MRKLAYINALRGLAIIIVVFSHVQNFGIGLYKMHPYIIPLLDTGLIGVQLFFILSAFTLFRSYHIRSQYETGPIKNFFIRRFFRIAPLFYIAIVYYVWQYNTNPQQTFPVTPLHIISSVAFLNSFSAYWVTSVVPGGWTIGIEMIFYMMLPVLFIYIKNSRQAFNFLVIAILFRLAIIFLLQIHPLINDVRIWHIFLYFSFPNQLFVFAFGILMYYIITDDYKMILSPKYMIILCILLILETTYRNELFLSKFFLFNTALFLFSVAISKFQSKILVNNFFIYIGKISYSVYLVHNAVFYWLKRFQFIDYISVTNSETALLNFMIRFIVVMFFSVLIGTVTYNLIEQPFIKLAERFIKPDRIEEIV